MRVGFRAWGILVAILAFACGARSTRRPEAQPPEGAIPEPSGNRGTAGAGAANPAQPIASAGSDAASAEGGAPQAGGEAPGAGAGPIEPCAGIAPLCSPGEPLCDPTLGVTATCDECGLARPDPGGKPCARLIASDKESSHVCIVRGTNEMQCRPGWDSIRRSVVPPETREVLLRDDGAAYENEHNRPCLRTGPTAYSCFPGPGCSHATLGDYGLCAVCDGKLNCQGSVTLPAVVPDPLIDITITDDTLFTLGAVGVTANHRAPRLPDFWKGSPRELRVDSYMNGCIVSTLNELACWFNGVTEPLLPSAWVGFRKLVPMGLPQACMLDGEGRVGCGDVFVGEAPPRFELANVVDLVASSSLACALTREGRVHCWDAQGAPIELPPDW